MVSMSLLVKEKRFYKHFFALLVPIALQNLIAFGANLADNMMLGAYSEDALTAVALVGKLQFVFQMVVGGVGEGLVVIGSQYWGQKNTQEIKRTLSVAIWFGMLLSLLFAAVAMFFPEQYMRIFTDDPGVIREGLLYLKWISVFFLFFGPVNILICCLRCVETVQVGFVMAAVALSFNVFFNYVFIFGNFGAPELGTTGAALATAGSQVLELIMLLVYFLWVDKKLRMKVKEFFLLNWGVFKRYIKMSLPILASNASWGVAMGIQTYILSSMGKTMVTADSISGTVFSLMMVVVYGSGNAANILIGKTVGENKMELIKPYTRTLQVLFLGLGLLSGAAIFLTRDLFLSFYGATSPESLALARQFLTVLSITSIGTAYQMPCLTGIVRGGGDTKFVFYNDMIFMWGIVLPISALATFVFKLPPVLVFFCLKSDQLLKCIVAAVKTNRYKWIRRVEEVSIN